MEKCEGEIENQNHYFVAGVVDSDNGTVGSVGSMVSGGSTDSVLTTGFFESSVAIGTVVAATTVVVSKDGTTTFGGMVSVFTEVSAATFFSGDFVVMIAGVVTLVAIVIVVAVTASDSV